MRDWLESVFADRPRWMNALLVFCAYMTFVYVPWDFFAKPVAHDEEVWLGVLFTGWAAKATEPLHWAIYAAGFYGFLRMRPFMWPWAPIYAGSVAVGMLVWPLLYRDSLVLGVLAFVPFALLTRALWHAEPLFGGESQPSLRERYGEWALVTGASAGIGAAFARALARQGLSVVLTARRREPLEALAAELERDYGVATRVEALDLADPEAAERLAHSVADLPIAVLVNNAGFGSAGRFEKQAPERLRDMVLLNALAPVLLTRLLLPGMHERGRGAVVFTGSVSGRQPLPLHAVYSATKSFEQLLGEALHVEQRERGVDVLVLEPGSTDTEFQGAAGQLPHRGDDPEEVVALALEALGKQPGVVFGWWNWLRANAAGRLLPRSLAAHLGRDVMARQTPEKLR